MAHLLSLGVLPANIYQAGAALKFLQSGRKSSSMKIAIQPIEWGEVPEHPNDGGTRVAEAVLLYTHPDCTYSLALKDELDEAGTAYEEIDLSLRPEAWDEVEKLADGERITPVLVENGIVSVGFHGVG